MCVDRGGVEGIGKYRAEVANDAQHWNGGIESEQRRGGENQAPNCGARFWRAVYATDCAADPRAGSFLGGFGVHGEGGGGSRVRAGGDRAEWRPQFGV